MLPCNVLLIDQVPGKIKTAAVNPVASMQAVANTKHDNVALLVSQKLKSVEENLRTN